MEGWLAQIWIQRSNPATKMLNVQVSALNKKKTFHLHNLLFKFLETGVIGLLLPVQHLVLAECKPKQESVTTQHLSLMGQIVLEIPQSPLHAMNIHAQVIFKEVFFRK